MLKITTDGISSSTLWEYMKYIQAIIILTLLVASNRYRKKWRAACDKLSDANDEVEASLRRIDALNNGGKPNLRVP